MDTSLLVKSFHLSIIPLAILFTWAYNGTNGSLFIVLVFHASYDALGDFVYPLFSGPGPAPQLRVECRRGQCRGAPRGDCDRACASRARLQAGDDACRRSGGSHLKR